jgi:hypothetical protein
LNYIKTSTGDQASHCTNKGRYGSREPQEEEEVDEEAKKVNRNREESASSSSSSSSLQSCYSNVAEMRRMNLEANMFLQRMKSVSANLQAEYDALESGLSLGCKVNVSSDLHNYISGCDDVDA